MSPVRALGAVLWLAARALLGVAALLAVLWWAAGLQGSLALAVQLAQRVPALAPLQVGAVQGSLRAGGSVEWLRWRQDLLNIEARAVQVRWSLADWPRPVLVLEPLQVQHLHIDDRRPASADPPQALSLPLLLRAEVLIDSVQWGAAPGWALEALQGRYVYDGQTHRLEGVQARMGPGQYRLQAQLGALAPLALKATLQAEYTASLPGARRTLPLQLQASAEGSLGGPDAALAVQAQLQAQLQAAVASRQQGPTAQVQARLAPWAKQPIVAAEAHWQGLDLAPFWSAAPHTDTEGRLTVTPASGGAWHAQGQLRNRLPGPWNQQRLPLDTLQVALRWLPTGWALERLDARRGNAQVRAEGQIGADGLARASAQASRIDPAALDSRLGAGAIDATLDVRQRPEGLGFALQAQPLTPFAGAQLLGALGLRQLQVSGLWQSRSQQLVLDTLDVEARQARLRGSASLALDSLAWRADLSLQAPGLEAQWAGSLAPESGAGRLQFEARDAAASWRWWRSLTGEAAPAAQGSASPLDQLRWQLQWQGGWRDALRLQTEAQGRRGGASAALRASASVQALADQGRLALESLHASGSLHDGSAPWTGELEQPVLLDWQRDPAAWAGTVEAGALRVQSPWGGSPRLVWQSARWRQPVGAGGATWSGAGSVEGLPGAWLERGLQQISAQLGLPGDLQWGLRWQAEQGSRLRAEVQLQREGGDLWLPMPDARQTVLAAGVRQASVRVTLEDTRLGAELWWDSARAGQVHAQAHTTLARHDGAWSWPDDAPLGGALQAQLPTAGWWSALAPPGWRLQGTLEAGASLGGTRAAPQWQGELRAQDLALRSVVDGIDLRQGRLRLGLAGQRLLVHELRIEGAPTGTTPGGALVVQGELRWNRQVAQPWEGTLVARAERLRVGTRADQRLIVSGQLDADLRQGRIGLQGRLRADQARFELPDETAPKLGADVRLRQSPAAPAPAAHPLTAYLGRVAVQLELGPRFEVQGQGVAARLEGGVELRAEPGQAPQARGEVRAVDGRYRAYGQYLVIEDGLLRFDGAPDNPALDVLAIRPNLKQRVGVRVAGRAQAPQLLLYADPDMPDTDKLAWLVLGRAAAHGSAEIALLQQAGMSLLGISPGGATGGLANALGLDELSMQGLGNQSDSADGTATAGATLTLGKRLSDNVYIAYERSLATALGTFYLFYELTRRLTVRAEAGAQSAIDLIFTTRYD